MKILALDLAGRLILRTIHLETVNSMTDYKLTREEQETIIRISAADKEWEIVTADPKIIRKMARQGYKPNAAENPWGYVSFTVPFNRIAIRRAEKRQITGKPFRGPANSRVPEDQNLPAMVG